MPLSYLHVVEQVAGGFPVETHLQRTVSAPSLAHQLLVVRDVKMVKDHGHFALRHAPSSLSVVFLPVPLSANNTVSAPEHVSVEINSRPDGSFFFGTRPQCWI